MSSANQRGSTYTQPGRAGFLPGNPGRKAGSKNKRTIEALRHIQEMDAAALAQLRVAVAKGESWAISYVLDRVVPKGRTIELDGMTGDDVIELACEGLVTPTELKDVAGAIAKLRELDDLDEMRKRLEELERMVRQ